MELHRDPPLETLIRIHGIAFIYDLEMGYLTVAAATDRARTRNPETWGLLKGLCGGHESCMKELGIYSL